MFVMIPKTMTDTELYDVFKQYGDIDYASIIRDRDTRESKGVAYVKYYKYGFCDGKTPCVYVVFLGFPMLLLRLNSATGGTRLFSLNHASQTPKRKRA